jgi:hypothetical protein
MQSERNSIKITLQQTRTTHELLIFPLIMTPNKKHFFIFFIAFSLKFKTTKTKSNTTNTTKLNAAAYAF